MKESQFRNKIYWFTFVFSILVVWVHSYNSELFLGKTEAAAVVYRIEHFLGDGIAQIAVPGFFMISAYLFYRNFTWERLWPKWNSRIHSVLVPFILWNALYYLGYVIGSRMPFVGDVVGKGQVPFGLLTATDAILHYTYNYVFWYLYQLILLNILAPVIYGVLQYRRLGIVALLGIVVALYKGMMLPHLNLDALLYYSVAAYAALHGKALAEGVWNKKTGTGGLILFCIAFMIRYVLAVDSVIVIVLFRLCLPIALWLVVDANRLPEAKNWMKYNFFLYATHFAVVRFVNKTAAVFLYGIFPLPLIIYLLMPVIVTFVSFYGGALLRRYTPTIWRLLNGNR